MPLNSTSAWPPITAGDRVGAALVRDVGPLHARALRELDAGELRRAADAGDGEVQLAGIGLGHRHQLLHVLHLHRRVHREHVRRIRHHHHRREILRRIERQLGIDARADHQAAEVGEQQRVAVGRALRDEIGADVAVRAGLVLDHDRLAPDLGELRPDLAREDVGGAAGRVGHDDADRLGRVVLRRARRQ